MKTCVSMKCPFIPYCKHYNFKVNHEGGCKTQDNILKAASTLTKNTKNS